MFDEIHEECGVFGVYEIADAASLTYYGLHSLQHRGQEASGIAACDGRKIYCQKGKGLTIDVFNRDLLQELPGSRAIGHVRYATAGGQEKENIQPIVARGRLNTAIVHNGQIVNDQQLRLELEKEGCIFQGTSDSEVILHLIQRGKGTMLERIMQAAARLEGAYSFLVMDDEDLYAVRDRHGLRPLVYARYEDGYLISSESCAFEIMNIHHFVDALPGEVLRFSRGLVSRHPYAKAHPQHMCAMEYIYFARPDSQIEKISVHAFRKESGRLLARQDPDLKADLVIGVPDSSLSAAIGYAQESGIPLETGLVKNRYIARTFIQPTQQLRDQAVAMKLSAIPEVLQGKSVVMIDDSIVRGTTSRRIVRLLKEAGAAQVHVRIAAPALQYPCFYGVDTSTRKELIAANMSEEEICRYIEADSLRFLSLEALKKTAEPTGICTACFNGSYCTPLTSAQQAETL